MRINDELRVAMGGWIFNGKITIDDLPEVVRRKHYDTFYVYAFRRLRSFHQVSDYVKVMRLMWADVEHTRKNGSPSDASDMMRRLFNAYWDVSQLFKGEEEFEKLSQTLAGQYPDIFGDD